VLIKFSSVQFSTDTACGPPRPSVVHTYFVGMATLFNTLVLVKTILHAKLSRSSLL